MAQLRVIKNRMGAVATIGRITKTMQMIATAKFTSAAQRASSTKPYTERIRDLVLEVSSSASDYDSLLLTGPSEPKQRQLMLVVITSDRGMCGATTATCSRLRCSMFEHVASAASMSISKWPARRRSTSSSSRRWICRSSTPRRRARIRGRREDRILIHPPVRRRPVRFRPHRLYAVHLQRPPAGGRESTAADVSPRSRWRFSRSRRRSRLRLPAVGR